VPGNSRFLALFLVALFRVKSVNFAELATGFIGNAKLDLNYKRLHRFFSEFALDHHPIARLVAHLMDIPQPWVLSIDRTNWESGGLVLGMDSKQTLPNNFNYFARRRSELL
jgi:hypothetical protein